MYLSLSESKKEHRFIVFHIYSKFAINLKITVKLLIELAPYKTVTAGFPQQFNKKISNKSEKTFDFIIYYFKFLINL